MKQKMPCAVENMFKNIMLMNRTELSELWTTTFHNPPPAKTSQVLMRKILAFDMQSKMHGGLDRKTKKQIAALQQQMQPDSPDKTAKHKSKIILKPGTRLLREWQGITHCVEVTENGFTWQGKDHRSLSAIARTITGAHWSGPRFFGLTNHNNTNQ